MIKFIFKSFSIRMITLKLIIKNKFVRIRIMIMLKMKDKGILRGKSHHNIRIILFKKTILKAEVVV